MSEAPSWRPHTLPGLVRQNDGRAQWRRSIPTSVSAQKKGCPRGAFLGLCEDGLVKGIPAGNYTVSKDNKAYAVRAAELLIEGKQGTRPYGNVQWIADTHYSIGELGTGTTKRLNLCHRGEIGLESSRCSPAG